MKIGIITIHNSPNYGASLQAFALWKYLSDLGNEVEIIDLYRPHQPEYLPSKRFICCRQEKKGLKRNVKSLTKKFCHFFRPIRHLTNVACDRFNSFNSQVKLSRPFFSVDELYASPPLYDIYITGSDQLWNPMQPFCLEPYFLTFVPKGKRRLSYASSIGITELTTCEKTMFSTWLKDYDAISVRETQAKRLIESLIEKKVKQVADPTFLLDRSQWFSMAVMPPKTEQYLLLFTLQYNPILLNYTLLLSEQSGLKVIYLTAVQPRQTNGRYEVVDDAGPKEWLGLIANAQMVITDSFHGTVFSLIMGTDNFFTYIASGNKRGVRITELLETYGLSDHLLNVDLNEDYDRLTAKKINHERIESIMDNEQNRSRQFLINNLQ